MARAYEQMVSEYPLLIIEADKLKRPQWAFAMATILKMARCLLGL